LPFAWLVALGVIIVIAVIFGLLSLGALTVLTLLAGFSALGLASVAVLLMLCYLCQAIVAYLGGRWILSRIRPEWNRKVYAPVLIGLLIWLVGWKAYLLVQVPVFWLGTATGVWLFYMQHQFEGVYWEHHEKWNFFEAGLKGCSYFKLPKILQWFTGNIGFHHIHHLSAKIPNYRLEACYRENEPFHDPPTLTLLSSMKSLTLRLYDEDTRQLVGWPGLKRYRTVDTRAPS
jgi:hypothetical protein